MAFNITEKLPTRCLENIFCGRPNSEYFRVQAM